MLYRTVEPLASAAFRPYGDVLDAGPSGGRPINNGTAHRFDEGGCLDVSDGAATPVLARFRAHEQALEGPWRQMERHRLGSQSFIPLGAARCVLVVALGESAPEAHTLRAFLVAPGQCVTLRAGVWHHPLIALSAGDFLVVERSLAGDDCELVALVEPVVLAWSTGGPQGASDAAQPSYTLGRGAA